jgi:hypothetical protein
MVGADFVLFFYYCRHLLRWEYNFFKIYHCYVFYYYIFPAPPSIAFIIIIIIIINDIIF